MLNSYNKKLAETAASRRKLIVRLKEKMTFEQIGRQLKISKQRVQQLYKEEIENAKS